MKRTIIVIVVALTVLVAGCGGPGDAPEEDEELPEEDPDDPAEEDPDDPDEGDDEVPAIGHSSLTSLAVG